MTMRDERDGAWSIDGQRGKLALKVTKERYESLGIVGRPKNGAYIIEVDLQEKTSSAFARAKGLLGKWDRAWDVWVIGGEDGSVFQGGIKSLKEVMPKSAVLEDVFVPSSLPKELEEDEPWAEIFEWVGLCTLGRRGSPRIRCQDQPNSYIACYSPPDGSRVASITRFRWEGFISEIFVRECVRVAKEEARDGLVAFSVQSYAHVTVPSSSTRYEARAGVGVSGDWALAEMMVPM
ncbi:hypothetical protein FRC12_013927 [Ceratobasidium sp. 428]|nr:hypothetical protein FRC12_013927 [Ceratobasidium sp. 428]